MMTVSSPAAPIERIVVTFDAAAEHQTSIDTAVRLAAHADASLHGVFIEDEDLLHLAKLPFACQVSVGTGIEELTSESVELHLRAAAERARSELFAAAKRHRVNCTFETVRGAGRMAELCAAPRDLVVAGGRCRPVAGHFCLERRWWSAVAAPASPLLLARAPWSAPGAVVTLLRDRDAASARLVEEAARIAAARNSTLAVMCPPAVAAADGFEGWIADLVAVTAHKLRMQIEVTPVEPAALRERLAQLDCRLLALDAGLAEGNGEGEGWRTLVERFSCDMLIVP